MTRKISLSRILGFLENNYGKPDPPRVTDPFEQILLVNVVYLASDEKRNEAFALLQKHVGLQPRQILSASEETLQTISSSAGILPALQVDKLRTSARIVMEQFQEDLNAALNVPLHQAKKVLRLFPAIGEPGAEKILLFSRKFPLFAVDSNGLRVLTRLGFAEERKHYAATYRSVQEALRDELKNDFVWLIRAHMLLRTHGKELCKHTRPSCNRCPVSHYCAYFRKSTES